MIALPEKCLISIQLKCSLSYYTYLIILYGQETPNWRLRWSSRTQLVIVNQATMDCYIFCNLIDHFCYCFTLHFTQVDILHNFLWYITSTNSCEYMEAITTCHQRRVKWKRYKYSSVQSSSLALINSEGALGSHCFLMHGSPGFTGQLENP